MTKPKSNPSICIQLRLARRIWPSEFKLPALLSPVAPGLAAPARSRMERPNRAIRVY